MRNAELADDLANPAQAQTSDIRYGKWSEKNGLKRGPLHPSEDFKRLEDPALWSSNIYSRLTTNCPFRFKIIMNTGSWMTLAYPLPYSIVQSARKHSQNYP